MLRWLVVLALAAGCGGPTASPSPTLAGTWAENFAFPGASLVLTIDGAGNGTGTYSIEAGRSGILRVSGSGAQPVFSLTLQYDYGPVRTLSATVADANHLTGAFSDGSGTVVFTRRQR
jgi:hypothetical protein